MFTPDFFRRHFTPSNSNDLDLLAAWCKSGHVARGGMFNAFLRNIRPWAGQGVDIGECKHCTSTITTTASNEDE